MNLRDIISCAKYTFELSTYLIQLFSSQSPHRSSFLALFLSKELEEVNESYGDLKKFYKDSLAKSIFNLILRGVFLNRYIL